MKKLLIIFVLALFIHIPSVRADCVLGTPNCDACAPGDTACVTNAQTIMQQQSQPAAQPPTGGSGFVPLAPIPGLTQGVTADTAGLATFFNNLYKFAIGMAAVLAVIQIIWGGIEIATNKDNVSKIIDSKGRILQAVLGLVLVLSPVLVFSIINPSILNLSINLEPLNTRSVPPATGSGTAADAVAAATAAGCTIADTGPLVKEATCTTQRDAQNFAANCNRAGGRGNVPFLNHRYVGTVEMFWATCDMTPPEPGGQATDENTDFQN